MQDLAAKRSEVPSASALPLCFGEQIARDARARLIAAGGVVLVHCAYPQDHPLLSMFSLGVQRAESLVFFLLVAFPVNAFILLSFLNLVPRLQAGVAQRRIFFGVARRLVPAHLFWVVIYLGMGVLFRNDELSISSIVEGIVLGTAASHLYFVPLLLALTAAVPLWDKMAKSPKIALASALALCVASSLAESYVGRENIWLSGVTGFMGLSPFAVGGIAIARWWQGIAPPPHRARDISRLAWWVTIFSMFALSWVWIVTHGIPSTEGEMSRDFSIRLLRIIYALSIPIGILSLNRPVPSWVIRWAPYTFGVYLIHPIFICGLRKAQSLITVFQGMEILLILPNALITMFMSLIAVALIAKTPLRRVVF